MTTQPNNACPQCHGAGHLPNCLIWEPNAACGGCCPRGCAPRQVANDIANFHSPESVVKRLQTIYKCPIWRTTKGDYIPITRMTVEHLMNAWKRMNASMDRATLMDREGKRKWIVELEKEMETRGMTVPKRAPMIAADSVARTTAMADKGRQNKKQRGEEREAFYFMEGARLRSINLDDDV